MDDLFPEPNVRAEELSADALAFVGDAVFNLYVKLLVLTDTKAAKLHSRASELVSRKTQSQILNGMVNLLNQHELTIVKRGINSKSARKHGNDAEYIASTGFEALVGYLFLVDKRRLAELLSSSLPSPTPQNALDELVRR